MYIVLPNDDKIEVDGFTVVIEVDGSAVVDVHVSNVSGLVLQAFPSANK